MQRGFECIAWTSELDPEVWISLEWHSSSGARSLPSVLIFCDQSLGGGHSVSHITLVYKIYCGWPHLDTGQELEAERQLILETRIADFLSRISGTTAVCKLQLLRLTGYLGALVYAGLHIPSPHI